VNERGHTRRFIFDQYGNPTKIVEENGAERLYTYDTANPMNRLTDRSPIGYLKSYQYDATGNVTQLTLPSDATVQYSHFNAFNQPGKIKDARGNYTIIKYDAAGNPLQTIALRSGVGAAVDPTTYTPVAADVVAWTISTYDAYGNPLSVKQVRNATTQVGPTLEYSYTDTVNNVQGLNAVTVTRRGDKDGDGVIGAGEFDTATLTYDALGRVTAGLRPDWYTTQAQYDAVDRVTRGTDAVGQLRDYSYDPNGNLLAETLRVGNVQLDQRLRSYDLSDRLLAKVDAGASLGYEYDPAGNVTAISNADGFTLRMDYDPNQRVVKASNEAGNAVTRTLDLDGKPRSLTDPNGHTVRSEYWDATKEGRLKTQRDALSRATTFDYDPNGNVTAVTDNLARTTPTTYDERNRPTRIVGPAYTDATFGSIRPVTKTTYDLLGRLIQVQAGRTDSTGTNPASDVVSTQLTYQWDDFGRKLRETDALTRSWVMTYDPQGNPLTITDPKSQQTTFTYGYGHQVLTRTAGGQTTTWTRNPLGKATQVQSPEVTYTYGYDPVGHRVLTATDSRGPKTLSYAWSPGGRLNSMQDSVPRQTRRVDLRARRAMTDNSCYVIYRGLAAATKCGLVLSRRGCAMRTWTSSSLSIATSSKAASRASTGCCSAATCRSSVATPWPAFWRRARSIAATSSASC